MISPFPACIAILAAALAGLSASAQTSPPISTAEIEAGYTEAIKNRTADIVVLLGLSDAAKSNKVTDIILAQYRALKARDETISAKLKGLGKEGPAVETAHAELFQSMSKPLHEQFLAKLKAELTPEQVEKVKDKMTYNKVKVTYDAYCAIVPGLTDADKAKILEVLKEAREEAMDGGSAGEKSRIFQKYKDRINDYLNAHGHDVAKAYRDWNAKQELASKQKEESATKVTQPTQ